MDESPQTKPLGIKMFSMGPLFSWPCSQRFWTVGDFWKKIMKIFGGLRQTRSPSQWTEMTLELTVFTVIIWFWGLFYVILLLLYYSVLVALGKYPFNCPVQVCVMVLIVKL